MLCFLLDLNSSTAAIGVSGQICHLIIQPFSGRTPQQIVSPPQVKITSDVGAPGAPRALGRFGQHQFPGFFEISHAPNFRKKDNEGVVRQFSFLPALRVPTLVGFFPT
jgi:hypothetical protein